MSALRVFFLAVLIVAQLGLRGMDIAGEGGIERIQATFVGIGIAIATSTILVPVIRTPGASVQPAKT